MRKTGFLYFIIFTAGIYLIYRIPNTDHNDRLACKMKEAKLSKIPMIKTALASYPGSGNTWIRHLIQQATGIATGSIYCEKMMQKTFIGECVDNTSTIVIKTHDSQHTSKYQRAVIVVRSPFRCLGSQFNIRNTLNQTGVASEKAYQKYFKPFVDFWLPTWRTFYQEWMNKFGGPKYIMFYDNLKKDIEGETRKLMKFLGVKYDENDFQCMLQNYEGPAHRTSRKKKDILPYFSPKQFNQIVNDILHIEQIAAKLNGEYHKIELYV